MEEDMRKLHIMKYTIWQRIENSGGNSHHNQPQEWETRNEDDDDEGKYNACTCGMWLSNNDNNK